MSEVCWMLQDPVSVSVRLHVDLIDVFLLYISQVPCDWACWKTSRVGNRQLYTITVVTVLYIKIIMLYVTFGTYALEHFRDIDWEYVMNVLKQTVVHSDNGDSITQ